MIQVDSFVAAEALEGDRCRFLSELISLRLNIPPIPRRVYADAEPASVVMLVEEYPGMDCPTVTFAAYDGPFLRDALRGPLAGLSKLRILSPDRRVLDAPDLAEAFGLTDVGCTRSFVCTSLDRVPRVEAQVDVLTEADEEAFVDYPLEDSTGRPERADLFRWLVREGRGEILGVRDAGDLVAYLSCSAEYGAIWDVEYVHVRPSRRRHGLGIALAASYARARLTQSQVPYWSGAANEASERTALKAGFTCCRELHRATAKVRGRGRLQGD